MDFTCVHCHQSTPIQVAELYDGITLICNKCGQETVVILAKPGQKIRRFVSGLQMLAESDDPQIPINRWMKSRRLRYPHFILYQQAGFYRSACGRIVTPDMEDITPAELEIIRDDYYGRTVCGSCFHSTRRYERDPLLEEWRKARNR